MEENKEENIEETKEVFCTACAAIPLALLGVGVAAGSKTGSNKKTKLILLYTGIGITVLSIIIAIIYIKTCKECR